MTSNAGPPPGAPQGEPSPEELMAAMIARLGQTPVRDILLQSMATFVDCAGIRLGLGPQGDETKDLTMARQAIEALRALMEVAERELGQAQVRPFKEPLAQLQLAYAQLSEGDPNAPAPPEGATAADRQPPDQSRPPGPGPEDAASRLWVPPGARKPDS